MIFDQYSRYYGVSSVLKACSIDFSSVLDIGSGPYCLLGRFLGSSEITYLDPLLEGEDLPDYRTIPQSVFDIDTADESFKRDFIVSIDTYEHIPPEKRSEFINRCADLAGKGLLFAFPCGDNPDAREVDEHVHEMYQSVFIEKYSWLKEHDEYGLPSTKELTEMLEDRNFHVRTFRHGNRIWLKELLPRIILLHEFPEMYPVIERVSEYFNNNFAAKDWAPDGYRTIVLACREPFEMKDNTGMQSGTVSDAEWKGFMNLFFSEMLSELQKLFDTRGSLSGNSEPTEIGIRDDEIKRLTQVVEDASNTINSMQKDVIERDEEILRLNGVVNESSSHMREMQRQLELRDSEIQRLQDVLKISGGAS